MKKRVQFSYHAFTDHDEKWVRVYRNLHKGCWSVRDCGTGLVIMHCDVVHLMHARGVVSEAGRQRVIMERRKNVHAFLEGMLCKLDDVRDRRKVTYNPYKHDRFMVCVGQELQYIPPVPLEPLGTGEGLVFSDNGCVYLYNLGYANNDN